MSLSYNPYSSPNSNRYGCVVILKFLSSL
ncbi:hypothetical protein CP082626L3_0970A, partial [Chlamydia psittaci 08-2626_L3]